MAEEDTPEALNLAVAPFGVGLAAAFGGPAVQQALTVRSTGDTEFAWTASENIPWLTLSKTTGQSPADLVLTIDPKNLPVGTHTGTISFSSGQAGNSPVEVTVTLQVTGRVVFLPITRRS